MGKEDRVSVDGTADGIYLDPKADGDLTHQLCTGAIRAGVVRVGRKVNSDLKLKPKQAWLLQLVMDEQELPQGPWFDEFRDRDRDNQYDKAMRYIAEHCGRWL